MQGFVKISKYAGMREDLVQAGGGNSSYKISEEEMAIKASGYQLADITDKSGYALVNPRVIKEGFLKCKDIDSLTESEGNSILQKAFIEGNRPSIETFLHSITGKYTLHTHPIVVNALTCRKDGADILKDLFPEALIVPYVKPGIGLAKEYFKAYKKRAAVSDQVPDTIFLQNHGLVVSADSADKVIERTESVTKKIEEYLGTDFSAYHSLSKIWNLFSDKIVWKVTDENILRTYAAIGEWNHAFCPDCVVFLGKKFLNLPKDYRAQDIENFREQYGEPVMVNDCDTLYIVADSVKKAMETQSVMSFSAQVMALNHGHDCNLLSDQEQNSLLNWDAEKYRKAMR